MTVEELEIIVTAKIEDALKELNKIIPYTKQLVKEMQSNFENTNFNVIKSKISQAVSFIKNKINSLRNSSKNNEIKLNINNKEAEKQITQLEKKINSLQEKIEARQMKLNIIDPKMDEIISNTRKDITPAGVPATSMDSIVDNALSKNKEFTSLNNEAQKLYTEIEMYKKQLSEAKSQMSALKQETSQTATSQNKLAVFFNSFKGKIEQAKVCVKGLETNFSKIPAITQNITNNIKNMGSSIKAGISHVLKYATALFSLRGIYSLLSSSAQSWLSSQNAGAQQLSSNIEYMKYALGSVFAPVIEYVINLVYQLMRAIQSVVYALSGVNIFANASAKSYKSMAGSAKKAKEETKQLAGIHGEITNVQSNNNSDSGSGGGTSPSFDLSEMEPVGSIIDAIKNSNWYKIGEMIGEKLNNAMDSIQWDKIQTTAKNIGTNIAEFLNGFIATTDWNKVGNTIAQGINTAIALAKGFVDTLNWGEFGTSIGTTIASTIKNINWADFFQTLSDGIAGLIEVINGIFIDTDYSEAQDSLVNGLLQIDSSKLYSALFKLVGYIIAETIKLLSGIKLYEYLWQYLIEPAITGMEDGGKQTIGGFFKGIGNAFASIGTWIYDNILSPFVEGFKRAFDIHSPSIVMQNLGVNVIQGLLNGISSLVYKVKEIWQNIKNNAIGTFTNIKESVVNKVSEIKSNITNKFQEAYTNIKNIFDNIGSYFSGVWNKVKNTFTKLGTSIGNAISSSVKSGINNVITLIENTINRAINMINGAIGIINAVPGVNITRINTLSIPRLAKGGVLTEPTTVLAGEYSGANTNPEIVAPQNIMYDTMVRAIEDARFFGGTDNEQSINLTVMVGNKKLGQILLEDLRDRKRQTGKDIEALVGG